MARGVGEFTFWKKEWALKAQREARKQGKKATLRGSRGHWILKVSRPHRK